jgi:hypothetical protein
MRETTIVTGPMRSGTSCVTGLLELCGFDMGRNIRVLRNETPMNPKGHFEHDLLCAVNERLLTEGGFFCGIFAPPPRGELAALAAERQNYFRIFLKEFDGELCKDPLFCLTLGAWLDVWPELRRAVFCLRHPAEVAISMQKRYGTDFGEGLHIWHEYSLRFFENADRVDVFVFDYNRFCREPADTFAELLNWLGRPVDSETLRGNIASFWSAPTSALPPDSEPDVLPEEVRKLYVDLLARRNIRTV